MNSMTVEVVGRCALMCGLILLPAVMPAAAGAQQKPTAPAWPPTLAPPAAVSAPVPAATTSLESMRQEAVGRHTKRGLIIGAIAGTLGGLGVGTFIYLFCETEGDDCAPVIPVVTVLGAASGAVAGAIIGAAIPRRAEPDVAEPEVREDEVPRRIGSFGAAAGIATATIDDGLGDQRGTGPVLRVNLAAELRPWLALGPEFGHAWLGDAGNIRYAALAGRGTWTRSRVSPYLTANLGAYQTTGTSREFLGGGIGVGARIAPHADSRYYLDLEARGSSNTQNIEPMRMASFSIGGGLYW